MLKVRPEAPTDRNAVFRVNREAFGRDAEARLVDALRGGDTFIPNLSLVATEGVEVVGHILFTQVVVRDGGSSRLALALAPLAVLPPYQNQGIGSALVRRGLHDAAGTGHRVVIVVGHPGYYPRFGFRPAKPLGLRAPFDVRDDAFLVLELQAGALESFRGEVEYPPAFAEV